jgi:hypothetical protein
VKLIPERRGKHEVLTMYHIKKGNSLTQANLQPKTLNKPIKVIFPGLPWQKLHSTRRRIFLPAHWT